ncbi:MAG: hypothetical protein HY360_00180 [Verrucomicrobia bacterium]|nr:hypothetical protein [Verrucomicrobiota bacterium]
MKIEPLRRATASAFRCETLRELTVAAIALKRQQLRYGKPPAALSALVPEFLSNLPCDYMDGKPLRYRLNRDGSFRLYSVGEDGRDDGGDPNPPVKEKYPNLWNGHDVVWPTPQPRKKSPLPKRPPVNN